MTDFTTGEILGRIIPFSPFIPHGRGLSMTAPCVKSVRKQTRGPKALYQVQEYHQKSCNVFLYMKITQNEFRLNMHKNAWKGLSQIVSKLWLRNGTKYHSRAGLIAQMHRNISTQGTRMIHMLWNLYLQPNKYDFLFHISSPCLYWSDTTGLKHGLSI